MEWLECTIETTSAGVEGVCGALLMRGIESVEIVDGAEARRFLEANRESWDYAGEELLAGGGAALVRFYLSGGDAPLAGLGLPVSVRAVTDDGWADGWKRYYKPFRLGGVVVRPEWEEYGAADGEAVVTLNPGSVFGTGLHQSTRLCAERLCELVRPGDAALDLGAGSGILGIIALAMGAGYVYAVDRDAAAAETAAENAGKNGFGGSRFLAAAGDVFNQNVLDKGGKRLYNLITANIVADAVIRLAPMAAGRLAEGGAFIAGGIIKEREADVLAAFEAAGLHDAQVTRLDEWVCVTGAR